MHISVIIPTRNRAKTLRATLSSLLQQDDIDGFEVIIVDNGSVDETKQVCAEFLTTDKIKFRYYYDAEPGLLTGRHLGASMAIGDVLCFIDDDVALAPSWIAGVKDAFKNQEVVLATGPCLPLYEIEPPFWLKYFWRKVRGQGHACTWLSLIDLGNKKRFVDPNQVWGLNFCIRKKTLLALGGFHPDNIPANYQMYQGDGETGLTLKVRGLGIKALYHPQIKLHHLIGAERLTPEYFEKRAFYQGVCDSFTLLRRTYLEEEKKERFNTKDKIKLLLKPLRNLLSKIDKLSTPRDIKVLKALLLEKEKEGFDFHQTAFINSPTLKQWVLKKDYWNYKLPN